MHARFATKCATCPERIQRGEAIAMLGEPGSGRWVHAACHPDPEVVAKALGEPASSKPAGRPKRAAARGSRDRSPSRGSEPSAPVPAGTIEVYTDEACIGNPGPGGWAWAVADGPQAFGADPATTNQRIELTAALEAVRALDGPLVVVSDSSLGQRALRRSDERTGRPDGCRCVPKSNQHRGLISSCPLGGRGRLAP
jgi:hypothetical protein